MHFSDRSADAIKIVTPSTELRCSYRGLQRVTLNVDHVCLGEQEHITQHMDIMRIYALLEKSEVMQNQYFHKAQ